MIIASTHQVDMAGTAFIAVNSNPHRIALGLAADRTPAEHSIPQPPLKFLRGAGISAVTRNAHTPAVLKI